MKSHDLKYWKSMSTYSPNNITLDLCSYDGYTLSNETALSCTVRENGLTFSTHEGGGHGEGTYDAGEYPFKVWLALLREAELIRRLYFVTEDIEI
jgi:hypothetical protein